jgi:hypothetical protein
MAGIGHKAERSILYLRASAEEPEQKQDENAAGETHRGVHFVRETIGERNGPHSPDAEIAAVIGNARKPVAAERELGRAEDDRQSNREGRRARG